MRDDQHKRLAINGPSSHAHLIRIMSNLCDNVRVSLFKLLLIYSFHMCTLHTHSLIDPRQESSDESILVIQGMENRILVPLAWYATGAFYY